jgi:3-hydroxymyristoyl/3-hydroxydecanoyl-(acyl carrier protein) dehydratase
MPRRESLQPLSLGPSVVQLLVAQRPPFLFVDRLLGISLVPKPVLHAARFITANEPVLAGHFPEVAVWPGALTLEGLSQTAACLGTLQRLADEFGLEATLAALSNVERGARLEMGHDPEAAAEWRARFEAARRRVVVLGGGAQVRLLKPVFPGCRLDYLVRIHRRIGDGTHFRLEAEVEGQLVAEGTLTGVRVEGA